MTNFMNWLQRLNEAEIYAQNNKDEYMAITDDAVEFRHGGLMAHEAIKQANRNAASLRNGEPDTNIHHIRDELGHVWRYKDGKWEVCKHGKGWEQAAPTEWLEPRYTATLIMLGKPVRIKLGSAEITAPARDVQDWSHVKGWLPSGW